MSMPVSVLTRMPASVGAPVPPVNDLRRGVPGGVGAERENGEAMPGDVAQVSCGVDARCEA